MNLFHLIFIFALIGAGFVLALCNAAGKADEREGYKGSASSLSPYEYQEFLNGKYD